VVSQNGPTNQAAIGWSALRLWSHRSSHIQRAAALRQRRSMSPAHHAKYRAFINPLCTPKAMTCLQTAPMTPMPYTARWKRAASSPTSGSCRNGSANRPSARSRALARRRADNRPAAFRLDHRSILARQMSPEKIAARRVLLVSLVLTMASLSRLVDLPHAISFALDSYLGRRPSLRGSWDIADASPAVA
jgi:hypothetical protein